MGTGISVSGIAELQQDLKTLGADLSDLKEAMKLVASSGESLAKGFAPRGVTGHLRGSIKGSVTKNRANIRADAKYSPYINYGVPKRGIQASYFLQRADKQISPTVIAIMERAIDEKVAKL